MPRYPGWILRKLSVGARVANHVDLFLAWEPAQPGDHTVYVEPNFCQVEVTCSPPDSTSFYVHGDYAQKAS